MSKDPLKNVELGEAGEKEVFAVLEKILFGNAHRFMGRADLGRDLHLQFPSPAPGQRPLDIVVQVKAGSSYAEDCGRDWRIYNIDDRRFSEWCKSQIPVILVWVNTNNSDGTAGYWKIIHRNSSRQYLFISKRACICPTTRFDLALRLEDLPCPKKLSQPYPLLRVGLNQAIRPIAKQYYMDVLMRQTVINPLLGSVKFTWRGWRHITNQSRPLRDIFTSLQLLSVVSPLIENPGRVFGFRRLHSITRGSQMLESRLIAFEYEGVPLLHRADARIILVLRERITFPVMWRSGLLRMDNVIREVTFESIYEKPERKNKRRVQNGKNAKLPKK